MNPTPNTAQELERLIDSNTDAYHAMDIAMFFSACVKKNKLTELKKIYASQNVEIQEYAKRYMLKLDRFDAHWPIPPRIAAFLVQKSPIPTLALMKFLSIALDLSNKENDKELFKTLAECRNYLPQLEIGNLYHIFVRAASLRTQSQYKLLSVLKIDTNLDKVCSLLEIGKNLSDWGCPISLAQTNILVSLKEKLTLASTLPSTPSRGAINNKI